MGRSPKCATIEFIGKGWQNPLLMDQSSSRLQVCYLKPVDSLYSKEYYRVMSKLIQTFAKNLRILRKKAGLSQEELAHRAGLHRTYVGSVEREERNISLKNVERLANALNVSATTLLSPKIEDEIQ